jgi:cytoplasmic iron level regulating protein YaaA (DUF328/UPF0246 family)
MKILLPPSETKAHGGDGAALDLSSLVWPELGNVRARLAAQLVDLSTDHEQAMLVLGLGARLAGEVEVNAQLMSTPTMPAIERYTGVLFDALDVGSLSVAARRRLDSRVLIGSALFGVVAAADQIPAYRLSGGVKLPGVGSLTTQWKPALGPLLAGLVAQELVVDLRSGTYQKLAPVPGAVTVRVVSERPDGSRTIVSHANKHTKGLVARELILASRACTTMEDIAATLDSARMHVEVSGPHELDVVLRS